MCRRLAGSERVGHCADDLNDRARGRYAAAVDTLPAAACKSRMDGSGRRPSDLGSSPAPCRTASAVWMPGRPGCRPALGNLPDGACGPHVPALSFMGSQNDFTVANDATSDHDFRLTGSRAWTRQSVIIDPVAARCRSLICAFLQTWEGTTPEIVDHGQRLLIGGFQPTHAAP